MRDLFLHTKGIPLYEQIYIYIKGEIKEGIMEKGEQLPSKRNLAKDLGVSTNTITSAYSMLLDEGYIYAQERKGYFVSEIQNLAILQKENREIEIIKEENFLYDLSIHHIDSSQFPIYTWRKITNEILYSYDRRWLIGDEDQGFYELRYEIMRYLRVSRQVQTKEENIIIGSGTEHLFQILIYLFHEDTIFAVENPGYKALYRQLEKNNRKVLAIDIDNKGLDTKILQEKNEIDILLVTPSHQFPTGVIMPVNRRMKLLSWAEKKNRYIIEDDYDSEFKYYGRPIPALKSLDTKDKVIYMGNFSKSISSNLRISYMVLPNTLLNKYKKLLPFMSCPVASLTQLTLAEFLRGGYFERYLNTMRRIYKEKRDIAIETIKNKLNKDLYSIKDSQAGLHFVIEIKNGLSREELLDRAKKASIYIESVHDFYKEEREKEVNPQMIIGYGGLKKDEIKKVLTLLLEAWSL